MMPLRFLSIFVFYFRSKQFFCEMLEHLECNIFTLALFIIAKPRCFFSHIASDSTNAPNQLHICRMRVCITEKMAVVRL